MYRMITSSTPTYMLIKYSPGSTGFVAYVPGISVFNIPSFQNCILMRFYPEPAIDLTPRLKRFQLLWKEHLRFRRWCSHPLRLRHRQMYGCWPPSYDRLQIKPAS